MWHFNFSQIREGIAIGDKHDSSDRMEVTVSVISTSF